VSSTSRDNLDLSGKAHSRLQPRVGRCDSLKAGLLIVVAIVLSSWPTALGKSELHFVRASFSPDSITGLAIVNPNDESATVTLTAYDPEGGLIEASRNPLQVEVGAGTQYATTVLEAFGSSTEANDVAWILAESSADDLTGFFLYLNAEVSIFDGGDIPEPAQEVVFNQVRVESGYLTELNLVNVGEAPAVVELTLRGLETPVVKEANLPAAGCLRFDVASFFQISVPPTSDESALYVRADSSQPLVGFGLVAGKDIVGFSARPQAEQLDRLVFPQLAVLGPFKSELVLVNYSTRSVIARVTAHQPDGTLYEPKSGGNPMTLALDPEAALRRDLETLFGFEGSDTLDGWLEVEASSDSLNGMLTYTVPSIGSAAGVATVAQGETSALFSHIATSLGFFTGVAALNPGTLAANLEMSAHRPDGSLVGSFAAVLRPGERVSRLIDEFVPDSSDMAGGFIRVSSDLPIYLTSLFGSLASGVLSNIPPQTVPAYFEPDSESDSIGVSPRLAVVQPGNQQAFTSESSGAVSWLVNSIPGGNPDVGTIDASGRYKAPATTPSSLPVTISAASGNRTAGASVDILSKAELLSGLGLVQSLAYLNSLKRLFAAELSVAPGAVNRIGPAAGGTSILDLTQSVPVAITSFPNETISEMVSYLASDGKEYLVMTSEAAGTVIRLNPSTGESEIVLSGLDQPSSLVIDDVEENLIVAEADEVSSYPLAVLDGGLTAAASSGIQVQSGGKRLLMAARSGRLAVDRCTGSIFVSVKNEGVILELNRLTGGVRTVASGLREPGALLGFYRRGVSCPAAFHLLVSERQGGRLTFVVPFDGTVRRWVDASDATSMTFLGEDNPLTGTSGIILSESAAQGSVIRFIPLPGIYLSETNNPLERKPFPPCSIRQLTKSSGTELELGRVSFSESGNTVVFSSTGDPVDKNPDGNEELFLLRHGARSPIQLTDTGTGRNQYPVVSPDGRWVMYRSDADGIGGGLGQAVLVLMDIEQGSSRVLPGILAFPGNFDGTGQQLTYTAAGNPLGSNPGGNPEVYLYDLGSETLSQLTNSSTDANFSPRLSSDGSRFAFLSTANIQGNNPGGNTFLFLADRGDSTIFPVAQVAAGGLLPDDVVFDMDAAGDRIAFQSKLDLVGQNPRHGWAVYLYDATTTELRQISPSRYSVRLSSMDSLGDRLALTSDGNPLQLNRDGNQEILIWNEPSQTLEQVTRSRRALNSGGLLSSDGSQLLFFSNADFTGENSDRGPEVFLGSCPVEE